MSPPERKNDEKAATVHEARDHHQGGRDDGDRDATMMEVLANVSRSSSSFEVEGVDDNFNHESRSSFEKEDRIPQSRKDRIQEDEDDAAAAAKKSAKSEKTTKAFAAQAAEEEETRNASEDVAAAKNEARREKSVTSNIDATALPGGAGADDDAASDVQDEAAFRPGGETGEGEDSDDASAEEDGWSAAADAEGLEIDVTVVDEDADVDDEDDDAGEGGNGEPPSSMTIPSRTAGGGGGGGGGRRQSRPGAFAVPGPLRQGRAPSSNGRASDADAIDDEGGDEENPSPPAFEDEPLDAEVGLEAHVVEERGQQRRRGSQASRAGSVANSSNGGDLERHGSRVSLLDGSIRVPDEAVVTLPSHAGGLPSELDASARSRYEEDKASSISSSRRTVVCLAVLVAALTAAVIGLAVPLAVLLPQRSQDTPDAVGEGGEKTPPDADDADAANDRFLLLKELLISSGTSSSQSLNDAESAQFRSLNWLANDDPEKLTLEDDGFKRIIQRYASAVLYLSSEVPLATDLASEGLPPVDGDGGGFPPVEEILSSGHECTWNFELMGFSWGMRGGISCDGHNADNGDNIFNDADGNGLGSGVVTGLFFGLQFRDIVGTLPPEIGALTHLRSLTLDGNPRLSGTAPSQIEALPNLDRVYLLNNGLSGALPVFPNSAATIKDLMAGRTQFSRLPDEVGNLSNLAALLLPGNRFEGTIPPSIANLSILSVLVLAVNRFTGSIPALVGDEKGQPNLINAEFYGNMLTGTIPPGLFRRTSPLKGLFLNDNALTGTMPGNEEGVPPNLTALFLQNNALTGTIPPQIGKGALRLQNLQLGGNELAGSVPASLGNLTELTTLSLARNEGLSGDMSFLCEMAIPNLVTDCPTNEDVICPCCEACCGSSSSTSGNAAQGSPKEGTGGGEDSAGAGIGAPSGGGAGSASSSCGVPFFLPDAMAYTRRFTFTTCCGRRMCGGFTCTD